MYFEFFVVFFGNLFLFSFYESAKKIMPIKGVNCVPRELRGIRGSFDILIKLKLFFVFSSD